MRIGIGYDIHGLKKGRPLILGGVRIASDKGCQGHSDGDVLLHALVDAVLGAASAGDIGEHFPPSDKRWKNAPSRLFAAKARAIIKSKGLSIEHLDAVVALEAPKLAGHRQAMRESVARAFGTATSRVGIKAKTNEGFGEIGRGRAVAAWAVALLKGR